MEKKMFLKASAPIFERAKEHRNNPTHSERLLWNYLRTRPLNYKFRRQHPIALYIADFYCHELKLIIEVDGNVHNELEVIFNGAERQKHLESEGLSFLRFTNDEVGGQLENVIRTIETYIVNHPSNKGIK
jgi:cyclase